MAAKISETRKTRGVLRIQQYIEMFESGEYEKVLKFCRDIEEIEDCLIKKKRAEFIAVRRFVVGIMVTFAIAIIGASVTIIKIFF